MHDRAKRPRILIVDDEILIADTLALIFNQREYEARAVYSAEQALETVAGWRPAVAILDIILPNMNGVDLANALKRLDPSMEAVLITGHVVEKLLLENVARGGHPFEVLTKPVQVSDLIENTERLLARAEPPGAN